MLVFLHPRILSRVSRFPVASPCLWGKLENMSYSCEVLRPLKAAAEVLRVLRPAQNVPRSSFEAK